jgi:hypothetical protein
MSIEVGITAMTSSFLSNKNTGLGNVLFQLASTYGLSNTYGRIASYHDIQAYSRLLKERFGLDHGTTLYRKFIMPGPCTEYNIHYKEPLNNFAIHDPAVESLIGSHPTKNIRCEGYYQSHKYFHAYREELLDLFSIDDASQKLIHAKYPILFDSSSTCVSIHFRTVWLHGITMCLEYYKEAIQIIQGRVSNAHFLIFADEIETVKPLCSTLGISYTIVEQNPDYIDLWVMTLCTHHILSFSTFSWWGAYLNRSSEKVVLYPYDGLRIVYGLQPEPALLERTTHHYFPEWTSLRSKSIL